MSNNIKWQTVSKAPFSLADLILSGKKETWNIIVPNISSIPEAGERLKMQTATEQQQKKYVLHICFRMFTARPAEHTLLYFNKLKMSDNWFKPLNLEMQCRLTFSFLWFRKTKEELRDNNHLLHLCTRNSSLILFWFSPARTQQGIILTLNWNKELFWH